MASFVTEAGIFIGQILVALALVVLEFRLPLARWRGQPEKRSLALGLVTGFGSFGQFALVPLTQILMVTGAGNLPFVLSVIMASMVAVPGIAHPCWQCPSN